MSKFADPAARIDGIPEPVESTWPLVDGISTSQEKQKLCYCTNPPPHHGDLFRHVVAFLELVLAMGV